jgi:hypothetical protein
MTSQPTAACCCCCCCCCCCMVDMGRSSWSASDKVSARRGRGFAQARCNVPSPLGRQQPHLVSCCCCCSRASSRCCCCPLLLASQRALGAHSVRLCRDIDAWGVVCLVQALHQHQHLGCVPSCSFFGGCWLWCVAGEAAHAAWCGCQRQEWHSGAIANCPNRRSHRRPHLSPARSWSSCCCCVWRSFSA